MTRAAAETYQIVMKEVAEESRSEAAMFLSGCFSLPPSSGRSIAASAPVALLAELERGQAEAVVAELRPALPEAVVLEIRPCGDADISRLQWPRPPRIYGKDLIDFIPSDEASAEAKCPHCGGMLRITRDGASFGVSSLAGRPAPRGGAAALPGAASDNDPLFSGLEPLATANEDYASLKSLGAGDTAFWMDNKGWGAPSGRFAGESPSPASAETSQSRRGRAASGLAAFMRPGVFTVILSRSRDPQVAKMIAEILGIPEPEAGERCLAFSLTVASGIALDEAQSLLVRLRGLGARARIARPA